MPWQATPSPAPRLLLLNAPLADELGLDPAALRGGRRHVRRQRAARGREPIAQAYAGHQFGGFSPRSATAARSCWARSSTAPAAGATSQLKGSGRTRFSRGGDGKAAVGPMLREYVISEAMAALGIPTTRASRSSPPASRSLRETVAAGRGPDPRGRQPHPRRDVRVLRRARRTASRAAAGRLRDRPPLPGAADAPDSYLEFFERVVERQAALIAQWMLVGFIHGVMNTDNMAISGETIDYGPCAFMNAYDPATVFSSIDHGGRYAYGNQPASRSGTWPASPRRCCRCSTPTTEAAVAAATAVLDAFPARYGAALAPSGSAPSSACARPTPERRRALADWLALLHASGSTSRSPGAPLRRRARRRRRGARRCSREPDAWSTRWRERWRRATSSVAEAVAAAMRRVNPVSSRATTGSRKRSPPRPPATSARSSACSRRCAARSTSAPALERYAEPAPPRSRPATGRSAAPDDARAAQASNTTRAITDPR